MNTNILSEEKIKALDNHDLIDHLADAENELFLSQSGYYDIEDEPVKDHYSDTQVDMLSEQCHLAKEELLARCTEDAKLRGMAQLNDRMFKVQRSLDAVKESGLNQEVMVYYLHHKSGVNVGDIRKVLDGQMNFFSQIFTD